MDADAVGKVKLVALGEAVFRQPPVVEEHVHGPVDGVQPIEGPQVPVEDSGTLLHEAAFVLPNPGELVVVLDLHDLVPLAEQGLAEGVLGLVLGGGVQGGLEHPVQVLHPQYALLHGGQHLHVHQRLRGAEPGALPLAKLLDPLQNALRGQDLLIDKIGFLAA